MRRAFLIPTTVMFLATMPAAASAYVLMSTGPSGPEVRFGPLPMKFNIHSGSAPGLTPAAVQQAVRAAYQAWTGVSCASFTVQDLGLTKLPEGNVLDRVNTHLFPSTWPDWFDPDAVALTLPRMDEPSALIIDADTFYNPAVKWSVTGAAEATDFPAAATHEIGHQLGLDDSDVSTATMFYAFGQGDLSARSLSADDIAGLCHLYPSGKPLPPECSGPEQCAPSETCASQKCVGGPRGYGSPCTSAGDCVSGLCVKFEVTTFCTQPCDTQACPGQDECVDLTPIQNVESACEPLGARQPAKVLGQVCAANDDCRSELCVEVAGKGSFCTRKCDATKACPSAFLCQTSPSGDVCVLGRKGLGEACASAPECESGLCGPDGSGKPICTEPCDPGDPCPEGFDCLTLAGQGSTCAPKSTAPAPPTDNGWSGCALAPPAHRGWSAVLLLGLALGAAALLVGMRTAKQ
jgi:hypothetical protein